jgi:hypothetical protein
MRQPLDSMTTTTSALSQCVMRSHQGCMIAVSPTFEVTMLFEIVGVLLITC